MTITKRPNLPQAVHSLAEQVGTFIEYWGFKKIHGVIWTHLYLSPQPLSAQELIAKLRVSKALISLSMKDLLHYRLILQTDDSLSRKNKFYVANTEVFSVIRGVLETRERQMLKRISDEFKNLQDAHAQAFNPTQIDANRLAILGKMVNGANIALGSMIDLTQVDLSFLRNLMGKFRN